MSRDLYRCTVCNFQSSITSGTIFHGTRKPLQLWFRAIWQITSQKHGVSALGIQKILGLGSYHTAWAWLHKLRVAMVRPGRDRLQGTVEVDEIYIGGKKPGKKGRGAEGKALILIAVELKGKRIGRVRIVRIADASAKSLEPAIQKSIVPNSVVRTDSWNGYNGLKELPYTHDIVRKDSDVGDNLLPHANLVASLLKRWILGTHQGAIRHSHLDYYLDEFTFRFNRRKSRARGKLFYRLLQQAVIIDHMPEKQLKDRKT
jgi:transposase-like protein